MLNCLAAGDAFAILMLVIVVSLLVFLVAGVWKTYEKAGQPGWAVLVPIYNYYIACKIAGKSGWWVLGICLPYVGVIFLILVGIDIAKNFGKSAGFGVGLGLLGFIFFPILDFGSAQYLAGGRPQPRGFPVQPVQPAGQYYQ